MDVYVYYDWLFLRTALAVALGVKICCGYWGSDWRRLEWLMDVTYLKVELEGKNKKLLHIYSFCVLVLSVMSFVLGSPSAFDDSANIWLQCVKDIRLRLQNLVGEYPPTSKLLICQSILGIVYQSRRDLCLLSIFLFPPSLTWLTQQIFFILRQSVFGLDCS
jgi:hypothetical protein